MHFPELAFIVVILTNTQYLNLVFLNDNLLKFLHFMLHVLPFYACIKIKFMLKYACYQIKNTMGMHVTKLIVCTLHVFQSWPSIYPFPPLHPWG